MTDLVKRLRGFPVILMDEQNLTAIAADRIEEQDKRISELEAKLERVHGLPERYSGEIYWDCETGNESCDEAYVSKKLIKEALADD